MQIRFRCPPELKAVLPKPIPAKRGLPDWLKEMSMNAYSADLGMEVRTVKQCPPFVDAMGFGFLMPLATDIHVDKGRFDWGWDVGPSTVGRYTRSPISFHMNTQAIGSPLFDEDRFIVKFSNFWTVELEPGYSLLVTHPFNRVDLPFLTLTGLVDADSYKDNTIQFIAAWLDADFKGVLPKGLPVAQCIPVPRQRMAMQFGELTGEAADRFIETKEAIDREPGTYRRRYRARKP